MFRPGLEAPMISRQGASSSLQVPYPAVQPRCSSLGRCCRLRNADTYGREWLSDLRAAYSARVALPNILHLLEHDVTFFQVHFPSFPPSLQPSSCVHVGRRVFPPRFTPESFNRKVVPDDSVNTGEPKLNRVRERSSEPQVSTQPNILRNSPRRNCSPRTVKTEQPSRVAGSNVRDHAVSTVKLSAPLASPEACQRKNSSAYSTLILERHR